MNERIEFDSEVEIGYIYIVNKNYKTEIKETEELEVNEFISMDIDKNDIVVGLEVFNEEAIILKNFREKQNLFIKTDKGYSFKFSKKEVSSRYEYNGLEFCFAQDNYTEFIGINVIDLDKYQPKFII